MIRVLHNSDELYQSYSSIFTQRLLHPLPPHCLHASVLPLLPSHTRTLKEVNMSSPLISAPARKYKAIKAYTLKIRHGFFPKQVLDFPSRLLSCFPKLVAEFHALFFEWLCPFTGALFYRRGARRGSAACFFFSLVCLFCLKDPTM